MSEGSIFRTKKPLELFVYIFSIVIIDRKGNDQKKKISKCLFSFDFHDVHFFISQFDSCFCIF